MKLNKIAQMSKLMRLLSDQEFRAIQPLLQEEAKIREKLARLEAQIAENRCASTEIQQFQSGSAQLLWQGWTNRTLKQLNTELAQVMAKKLVALDRVRVAFGRRHAVDLLQSKERHTAKTQKTKRRDSALQAFN